MSLGNKLMALGQWFETHFPEKLTAAEVNAHYNAMEYAIADLARRHAMAEDVFKNLNEANLALTARVADLEKKAETFNSDINKTKVMLLTQRQTR